ncbi:hypothetical protein [Luteolibacter sp.]|uniref:hypothetical protein n=1 Tax=Luteolibacter sp. TaxID=1962973 RepID=UPI0032632A45
MRAISPPGISPPARIIPRRHPLAIHAPDPVIPGSQPEPGPSLMMAYSAFLEAI